MRYYYFILIALFACSEETAKKEPLLCTLPPTAYSPWLYTAHETYQEPLLDGKPLEKSWQLVRWNPFYSDTNLKYKILWYYDEIFILTKYPIDSVNKRKDVNVSVFMNDSLLYCRQNSLLKEEGYDYKTSKENKDIISEIKLRNIIHPDSVFLNKKGISINFSCHSNQENKIRLEFIR